MNGVHPSGNSPAMQSRLFAAIAVIAALALARPAAAQDTVSRRATISETLRDLELAARRVRHLLTRVREGGEAQRERAICVDQNLSQIHSVLRLALEREAERAQAERRGDRLHADRERALVRRYRDDVRRLETLARLCVDPEPALPSGITQVIVTIEPWVPELNVSSLPRR